MLSRGAVRAVPWTRFQKGWQHLSARRALIYSRIRENQFNPADTDISRARHQQEVLEAALSRAIGEAVFGTSGTETEALRGR